MNLHRTSTEISVVIPTHLPRCLDRTLLGLSRQTEPGFEVIVVENGTLTDEVSALCKRWRSRLNLSYRFDPCAGLNRARNTGARMASGRCVALLDDDCEPAENWVESILVNQGDFPDAAAIGGPVRLEFETRPPDWLIGEFRTCLSELDRGPAALMLGDGEYLFGANMSFSKSAFERAGGFPEGIGMNTRKPPQLANDEISFLDEASRVSNSGLIYCPDMSVTHIIPACRVSLSRMFQRRFGQGLSDFALMQWRHGLNSDKIVERYLNNMFPHPWHFEQFNSRRRELEPETAEKYLYNHVVCRTGYLWGYRQALLESPGPRTSGAKIKSRMDKKTGRSERLVHRIAHTEAGGDSRTVASTMAELMYRGNASDRSEQALKRADNRLSLLVAMAGLLEPGLFRNPLIE